MARRTYDDETLVVAVAESRSWREVMRRLGLSATSAASARSVRRHAERLGLDFSHFTGQRRWTEAALAESISSSHSWAETARRLGLSESSTITLKGHATRLGIDTAHLSKSQAPRQPRWTIVPDRVNLPRAGSMLAAAWFTLSGYQVSWPLEPCRYDLVAHCGDSFLRVQVKTSQRSHPPNTWLVSLKTGGRRSGTYDPEDIDHFFVVDGDLDYYLIPVATVGGMGAILVSAYQQYKLTKGPLVPAVAPLTIT